MSVVPNSIIVYITPTQVTVGVVCIPFNAVPHSIIMYITPTQVTLNASECTAL